MPADCSVPADHVLYVLKMYPRFSETFILGEMLAHQAAGLHLSVVSLRPPNDGRFHAQLAELRAPVTYLDPITPKAPALWAELADAAADLPRLPAALPQLLAADVRDAYQAVLLARHAQRTEVTTMHAHFASLATTVARLASALTGVPYTFTAHAKDIFHEDVVEADLAAKLRDAASCVTVSDFNEANLRDRFGADADRVVRVFNGIDLSRFSYTDPGLERPPRVVAVGRLVEKKGFADLIHAAALLARRGQPVAVDIIGTGELAQALQDQIDRLGIGDHVRLVGALPQDDVRDAVAGASALAAPCVLGSDGNRDGLPTVLLEAMALGTPTVAADVTGIPEVVRHEHTGLLIGQHDPAALADALARLMHDSDLRVRLARQARRLIEADFDLTTQAAHVRAAITSTATAAPAPAPGIGHTASRQDLVEVSS